MTHSLEVSRFTAVLGLWLLCSCAADPPTPEVPECEFSISDLPESWRAVDQYSQAFYVPDYLGKPETIKTFEGDTFRLSAPGVWVFVDNSAYTIRQYKELLCVRRYGDRQLRISRYFESNGAKGYGYYFAAVILPDDLEREPVFRLGTHASSEELAVDAERIVRSLSISWPPENSEMRAITSDPEAAKGPTDG